MPIKKTSDDFNPNHAIPRRIITSNVPKTKNSDMNLAQYKNLLESGQTQGRVGIGSLHNNDKSNQNQTK
jgi:hypothetical protein